MTFLLFANANANNAFAILNLCHAKMLMFFFSLDAKVLVEHEVKQILDSLLLILILFSGHKYFKIIFKIDTS